MLFSTEDLRENVSEANSVDYILKTRTPISKVKRTKQIQTLFNIPARISANLCHVTFYSCSIPWVYTRAV